MLFQGHSRGNSSHNYLHMAHAQIQCLDRPAGQLFRPPLYNDVAMEFS